MSDPHLKDLKARYLLFDKFALKDQKQYYKRTIHKYRRAAAQVNQFRAFFSLLTGISAAAAGLIVQTSFTEGTTCNATIANVPDNCNEWKLAVIILAAFAIVLPAIGAIFSTLADLYQWDKLSDIFEVALQNLEVADSLSPSPNMPDEEIEIFGASVRAFAQSTLDVMSDETAQWGQSIRTPAQIEHFIEAERQRAEQARIDLESNDS